jgi:hypothetical protein
MFSPIMSGQRLGNLLGTVGTARIPKSRQVDGVPLARHDRTDDRQPSRAGDIGQHLGQLHVHLLQGLLHVLDMGRAIVKQRGPMAQVSPQGTHLSFRTKRATEQATGMQVLNPLAILHVSLAPRHMLEVTCVDHTWPRPPG